QPGQLAVERSLAPDAGQRQRDLVGEVVGTAGSTAADIDGAELRRGRQASKREQRPGIVGGELEVAVDPRHAGADAGRLALGLALSADAGHREGEVVADVLAPAGQLAADLG